MSICRMLFQWASAIKIQLMLSSTKRTPSLSRWKLTCSPHDQAEKVLSCHKTTITHSLDSTRKNIGFILNSLWPTYLMLSCSNFLLPDQNPNKGNCFNWPTGPTGVEWRVLESCRSTSFRFIAMSVVLRVSGSLHCLSFYEFQVHYIVCLSASFRFIAMSVVLRVSGSDNRVGIF